MASPFNNSATLRKKGNTSNSNNSMSTRDHQRSIELLKNKSKHENLLGVSDSHGPTLLQNSGGPQAHASSSKSHSGSPSKRSNHGHSGSRHNHSSSILSGKSHFESVGSTITGGGHSTSNSNMYNGPGHNSSSMLVPASQLTSKNDISRCPFLYSQSSYSSLYSDTLADDSEPGPNSYKLQQALGQQIKSHCASAPSISIPAKHSESWSKVFVSREQSESSGKARDTPGPGTYTLHESCGGINPLNGVRFSTSKRPEPSYQTPSPGPIYDITRSNLLNEVPTTGFSKGKDRLSGNGMKDESIGPGRYDLTSCPLSQAIDVNRLAKSFASGRDAWEKVIFPGCEKAFLGRACDLVGEYKDYKITLSRQALFSKDKRKSMARQIPGPGPGEYNVCGMTNEAIKTKPTYSFGKPPPKARLNWKRQCYETSTWARLGMSKNVRQELGK